MGSMQDSGFVCARRGSTELKHRDHHQKSMDFAYSAFRVELHRVWRDEILPEIQLVLVLYWHLCMATTRILPSRDRFEVELAAYGI